MNPKELKKWQQGIDSTLSPKRKNELKKFTYSMMLERATKPQQSIIESRELVNLFLAGQGSGKTQCMGYLSLFFATNFAKAEGIIAANTKMQLSDSTLKRIFATWAAEGYIEYHKESGKGDYVVNNEPPTGWTTQVFDKWDNKIVFRNGAIIYTGSLDNYKAHDGKEVSWILLDETKDTKQEALTEVLLGRLRQLALYVDKKNNITDIAEKNKPFNPIYLFTSPAKVQWLNEYFKLEEYRAEINRLIFSETTYFAQSTGEMKYVCISSTYLNTHINSEYIGKQKATLTTELQDMNIYGCPFSRAGGEAYKEFDRNIHVKKCEYNPELPVHLTFDFNVSPYVTLLVWQGEGKAVRQIDEICATYPNNSTRGACRIFAKNYPAHSSGMFIYGDPSGRAKDTRLELGWNDYDLITSELKKYKPALRVASKAPSIVGRIQFINIIFKNNYQDCSIAIDPKCKETILDYTMIKEAPDGSKVKKKAKNKQTGIMEEVLGHTSDANDYFLCEYFRADLEHYKYGGTVRRDAYTGRFTKNYNR